jgi:hypothetical protein
MDMRQDSYGNITRKTPICRPRNIRKARVICPLLVPRQWIEARRSDPVLERDSVCEDELSRRNQVVDQQAFQGSVGSLGVTRMNVDEPLDSTTDSLHTARIPAVGQPLRMTHPPHRLRVLRPSSQFAARTTAMTMPISQVSDLAIRGSWSGPFNLVGAPFLRNRLMTHLPDWK